MLELNCAWKNSFASGMNFNDIICLYPGFAMGLAFVPNRLFALRAKILLTLRVIMFYLYVVPLLIIGRKYFSMISFYFS
jgi:hypothetical protein